MRSSRGIRTRRATNRVVGAGVAGVAVVGVVLAGCTTEPGPEPSAPETTAATTTEPTATPTPTESVAPETVKPERPEAMDEVSVEGAEAVARYFLELYPYVYATGDLTDWERLSHPECVFCESVIENVAVQEDKGHTSSGGVMTPESLEAVKTSDDFFLVTTVVSQTEGVELAADGSVVDRAAPSRSTIQLALVPRDDQLIVREVQVDDPPSS